MSKLSFKEPDSSNATYEEYGWVFNSKDDFSDSSYADYNPFADNEEKEAEAEVEEVDNRPFEEKYPVLNFIKNCFIFIAKVLFFIVKCIAYVIFALVVLAVLKGIRDTFSEK